MPAIGKYKDPKSDYRPKGSAGNGKRDMYECGTSDCDYYTPEEFEFLRAVDKYRQTHNRHFPAYHEILRILKSLGYRKQEAADANRAPGRTEIAEKDPLPFVSRAS